MINKAKKILYTGLAAATLAMPMNADEIRTRVMTNADKQTIEMSAGPGGKFNEYIRVRDTDGEKSAAVKVDLPNTRLWLFGNQEGQGLESITKLGDTELQLSLDKNDKTHMGAGVTHQYHNVRLGAGLDKTGDNQTYHLQALKDIGDHTNIGFGYTGGDSEKLTGVLINRLGGWAQRTWVNANLDADVTVIDTIITQNANGAMSKVSAVPIVGSHSNDYQMHAKNQVPNILGETALTVTMFDRTDGGFVGEVKYVDGPSDTLSTAIGYEFDTRAGDIGIAGTYVNGPEKDTTGALIQWQFGDWKLNADSDFDDSHTGTIQWTKKF